MRLMTLNPGHFHAALVQKEMIDGIDPLVHVYAPLDADLLAHLHRIVGFNTRADHPTRWRLDVCASDDSLERMLAEKPGEIVVIAGRNARKIDAIEASIGAGLHVLADKPWILTPDQLPRVERVLAAARKSNLFAYDIMTERYEITSILQRDLVGDPAVFGEPIPGTPESPGVVMESVHYLKKLVAGAALRRPSWFFDVHEQGEGLSDVGTHLVDLVMWVLFADQAMDAEKDVNLLTASRRPTELTRDAFRQITGEDPPWSESRWPYFCNTRVAYSLRGIHVRMDVAWDVEAEAGTGDRHLAVFRGTRASVEVRQGPEENYRPKVYIIPARADIREAIIANIARHPGVGVTTCADGFRLDIPEQYRVGHEAHFAEVTRQFLRYVRGEATLPTWEAANMIAKYKVTTGGVALARRS